MAKGCSGELLSIVEEFETRIDLHGLLEESEMWSWKNQLGLGRSQGGGGQIIAGGAGAAPLPVVSKRRGAAGRPAEPSPKKTKTREQVEEDAKKKGAKGG